MSPYFGFQLALELSNVLPLQGLAQTAYDKTLDLARNLRNSGSDIVVEEDLANIFGRGRVSFGLEKSFKEAVKISKITPLYQGCEVELRQGPGPTLLRAFQEKYLATIITLAMLGYFHGRNDLASLMSNAMNGRFEAGVPGSSYSSGHDGISGTLESCSTQCSEFQWIMFQKKIEMKLASDIQDYRYCPRYCQISKTVFQGAVDFFFIAQSLPEDRKVAVSNQNGCIPLIIWAHYILDLAVVVTEASGGNSTVFGDTKEPQVYIRWQDEDWKVRNDGNDFLDYWKSGGVDELDSAIRLLDKDMTVILSCEPQENDGFIPTIEERHTLSGYGTTFLYRILNLDLIARRNDPMYNEMPPFATDFAIRASQIMDLGPCWDFEIPQELRSKMTQHDGLEFFRIMTAFKLSRRKCQDMLTIWMPIL